ncbi:MAG: heme NO-binding domain-containing protein [Flavobacteriales bacterium]|nr:heme NO-binding domain-containing protein [Flavobacteriales bacterium]
MKGMIFTEFLDMVEEKFGYETVDYIIKQAEDPEDGAYTSVSTYDHKQLVQLIVALHKKSGISLRDLQLVYGRYLFGRLAINYPRLLEGVTDPFDLLLNIELMIHTEVRKLYPEANPPKFIGEKMDENSLNLIYHSHRSMGDVAEGLMLGCGDYFGVKFEIEQEVIDKDGHVVEFRITKVRSE